MLRRIALSFALLACLPVFSEGQEELTSRVAVAGGLLGHTEGFPELPSSRVDLGEDPKAPVRRRLYGGVEGLRLWLTAPDREKEPIDLLLLGGDNLPLSIGRQTPHAVEFMKRLGGVSKLQQTVVGLSTQDIVRFLRGASIPPGAGQGPAHALEAWIAASPVSFIASNAVIKMRRDNLNTVTDGGITLEIDADVSLGWEKTLTFSRPCQVTPTFTLTTGGQSVAVTTSSKAQGESCHSIVSLAAGGRFEPGADYRVTATVAGQPSGQFRFFTHRALTPSKVPGAGGFPVAPPTHPRQPWVMALVDPETATYTGTSSLKWDCVPSKTTCELAFLPALDIAHALLDAIKAREPDAPPFVTLLSSMPDAGTSEVLAATSVLRIVVLPADSGLLGRAADEGTVEIPRTGQQVFKQEIIAELRSAALVDGRDPSASALFARPEWLAETVVTVEVRQTATKLWRSFLGTTFGTQPVFGAALCWSPVAGGQIQYSLNSPSEPAFETHVAYPAGAALTTFPPNGTQRDLWVDPAEFAAAALDVMRASASAELAIAPASLVDDDVVAWLAYVRDELNQPLNWLSRLVLERALYGADGYVRVVILGKELVATVNKILQGGGDDPFCAAGFGHIGCGLKKLDAEHLLVNGRHIDEGHYYSVALFRSLADRYALDYNDDDVRDIVEDLDARLRIGTGAQPAAGCTTDLLRIAVAEERPAQQAPADADSLAADLEKLRDGPQSYVRLEPMKVDFAITNTTLPNGANAALLGQAIEGASPKDSQRWQVDTAGDLGIVDTRRWAFRGVGSLEYQQEEVSDVVSVDKDEFVLGLRVDHKIRFGNTTARVFGGRFWEGALKGRPQKVATSRVLEQITDPADSTRVIQETIFKGPELAYSTRGRRFNYWGFGAELAGWSRWKWWKVTQFSVQGDFGRSGRELAAVLLNDEELSVTEFLKDGAEKLLKKHFTDAQRNPGPDDVLSLRYEPLDQDRLQFNFNTEHPLGKLADKDVKLTNEFRYRRYSQDPSPVAYSLRWSVKDALSLTLPVWGRLSAVLKAELNMVEVAAINRPFEVLRYTAGFELPLFGKRAAGGLYFR